MNKPPKDTACSAFNNGKYVCNHGFIQNQGCTSSSIRPCGCRIVIPNCLNEEVEDQPKIDRVGI